MTIDIPTTPQLNRRSAKSEAFLRASPISPAYFTAGDLADPTSPRAIPLPLSPLKYGRSTDPSKAVTPKGMKRVGRGSIKPTSRPRGDDSGSEDDDDEVDCMLLGTPAKSGGGAIGVLRKCLEERQRRQSESAQRVLLRTAEKGKRRAVEEDEEEDEDDAALEALDRDGTAGDSAPSTPHRARHHHHSTTMRRHIRRQHDAAAEDTDVFSSPGPTAAPSGRKLFDRARTPTAVGVNTAELADATTAPSSASVASALAVSVSIALNSAASVVNSRQQSILSASISSALSEAVSAVNSRSNAAESSRSVLAASISSALSVAAGVVYSRTETATPHATAATSEPASTSPVSDLTSSGASSGASSAASNAASGSVSSSASLSSTSADSLASSSRTLGSSSTSSSAIGSAASAVSNASSTHHDLIKKVVPGVVVPVVIILGLLIFLCCCFRRKDRRSSSDMKSPGSFGATLGSSGMPHGVLSPTSNPMSLDNSQGSFSYATDSPGGIGRAIGEPQTHWGRRSLLDVMAGAAATLHISNGRNQPRAYSGSSFGNEDDREEIRQVGRQRSMASFSDTSSARGVGGYNSKGGYQPGQIRPVVPSPVGDVRHQDPFSGPGVVPVSRVPVSRQSEEQQRESMNTLATTTTYNSEADSEDDYHQAIGSLPAAEASRVTQNTQATATGDEAYFTDDGGSIATEHASSGQQPSVQFASTGSEAGTDATPTMSNSNWRDSEIMGSQAPTPTQRQEILRSPGKEGTWW